MFNLRSPEPNNPLGTERLPQSTKSPKAVCAHFEIASLQDTHSHSKKIRPGDHPAAGKLTYDSPPVFLIRSENCAHIPVREHHRWDDTHAIDVPVDKSNSVCPGLSLA
jgi:hypothetical protein